MTIHKSTEPKLSADVLLKKATDKSLKSTCEQLEGLVNEVLQQKNEGKKNSFDHCDDATDHDCDCGHAGGDKKLVDLIILLDSSGSMSTAGKLASDAAIDALAAAKTECPSDLRINWFTVDGKKPGVNPSGSTVLGDITLSLAGTNFTHTHQQYLMSIGSTGPFQQDAAQPLGDSTYGGEEGADAIADLCNFYDWRKDACKAIFYVSDTALDGLAHNAVDDAAALNASTVAQAKGVVLFAHKIDPGAPSGIAVNSSYANMCNPTGGSAYIGPVSLEQYKLLIKNAICNACGNPCKEVDIPKIEPCISITWGDSDCDCIETDDVEVAMITICNCYSNISFSNVHISYCYITMPDGSDVPMLPDGTPSVQAIPLGPICFGDIGPCREGETNCVSREIVIRTRGAKGGKYKINVGGICYEIVQKQMHSECFTLTLCSD